MTEEEKTISKDDGSLGSFRYSEDLELVLVEDDAIDDSGEGAEKLDSSVVKPESVDRGGSNLPAGVGSFVDSVEKNANRDLNTIDSDSFHSLKNNEVGEVRSGSVRKEGRIGDRLVSMGVIDEAQLNVALQQKKISGGLLGSILVELGFLDKQTLTMFLSESSGFEVFDPKQTIIDGEALCLLEKNIAQKHQVLPISILGSKVHVAMCDPYDVVVMDVLRRYLPKASQVVPVLTTNVVIGEAIDAAYGYASSISGILQELEGDEAHKDVSSLSEDEAFSHPIVRLVNALVFDAVKMGASDLHFEPEEHFVRLRYRIDGVLHTEQTLHRQHWNGISQRLKIMSKMDIADKFSPQDGRFELSIGGRNVDFRVSALPTVYGENIVLRVLDQSVGIMALEDLGFSDENIEKIRVAQSKPEGITIVTGPTGSGKTTSLYSMLNEINTVDVNIQTLEDPVEYTLPMIRQTYVREGVMDFSDGIKALLRQDPDIIFVGEIRDKTTAEMSLKAAMTGHQVYTSLHTNASFGAIPRLLDLGIKPGMLAGAIVSVYAQRLVRKLCTSCKVEYTPDEKEREILGLGANEAATIYKASEQGCAVCQGKSYKGRIAVAEILLMDEEMDELIAKNSSKAELKQLALKKGFKSMKDDGIVKVLSGITSIEALSKVVDLTR